MSKQLTALFLFACLYGISPAIAGRAWHKVLSKQSPNGYATTKATQYLMYSADEALLGEQLSEAAQIELPMADGTFKTFSVSRSSLLPAALMARYPGLAAYTGVAVGERGVSAKIDITLYGIHAIIFKGSEVSFIDPANDLHDGYYAVHDKRDEVRQQEDRMSCKVTGSKNGVQQANGRADKGAKTTSTFRRVSGGEELRTYRLAISCDHQYALAATGSTAPTREQVLAKIVTTMNRVSGVYERELSVSMQLVPNEDTILFLDDATDPLGGSNDDATTVLAKNQTICDSFIGNANYDIGHVFTTGAGGLSQLSVVCVKGMKAQSVTGQSKPTGDGFDIDYVAHEMGHEFGSDHTFNDNTNGSCYGNAVMDCAYEPGSGSTIMCYAGICDPDNVQLHSDAYFSGSSLDQIQSFISNVGNTCAVRTPTNNKVVSLPAFSTEYTIPYQTPFELTAPVATDQVADTETTYCWEQWDLGDFGVKLTDTHFSGPLFRSYSPVISTTRSFPNMDMVLAGSLSNAGVNNASGEKAADVSRQLTFRLAVRDVLNGHGCILIPEDTVALYVINTGAGFKVTSQATDGIVYTGNTDQQITWDVAGSAKAPIKAATVDIYMSADSGRTWTYNLGTVPNSGSATMTIPNPDTSIPAARFKVKGTGNVFFNVNSKYFRVNHNLESAIHIYPVPAHDVLHIVAENSGVLQAAVYNSIGQCVWKGAVSNRADLPAYVWGRGVYFLKIIDDAKRLVVRKIVID